LKKLYIKTLFYKKTLTRAIDLHVDAITKVCGEVHEGDIIILEYYDNMSIISIWGKDDTEKQRRIKLLEEIMNS